MVLQQKSDVQFWGTAKKSVPVIVTTSWDNKKYTATSNASGEFNLVVKTPSAGGYNITFSDGEKLLLNDVLIGEVWLCSGQSNMEIPVKGFLNQPVFNSNDLLLDAENYPIRLFRVKKTASAKPLTNADANWEKSTAESVKEFSAVGYQFAKILQQQLHVPVGIIATPKSSNAIVLLLM